MVGNTIEELPQAAVLTGPASAEPENPAYARTSEKNSAGPISDDITAMRERRLDANHGKRCFVIMPFGTKVHPFTGEKIDFDAVYSDLISVALDGILDAYSRSDSATAAGLIHSET